MTATNVGAKVRCVAPTSLLRAPHTSAYDNSSCACGASCPLADNVSLPPALIISGSGSCFARARQVALRGGFASSVLVSAAFVDAGETAAKCCKQNGTKCGRGRRSKPASRARMDGVTGAHRRAWKRVLASGAPYSAVFEDDVELLGSAADVRFAMHRCRELACDLAYLGLGHDGLLAHACTLVRARTQTGPHAP